MPAAPAATGCARSDGAPPADAASLAPLIQCSWVLMLSARRNRRGEGGDRLGHPKILEERNGRLSPPADQRPTHRCRRTETATPRQRNASTTPRTRNRDAGSV